jgi:two-component system sensor histidine kinase/response regulator
MKDKDKTKAHLISELTELRQRVADMQGRLRLLEASEAERKHIEESLRRERDFAEGLVETAQAIVLVLDTQGRIVRFNPYMEEISGYQLEEVQGKDWFTTFLPKRDRRRIQELFLKAVDDTRTRGNVNAIVARDGHEREIEWYDKTLKDADGGVVIGLLAIGQDVTERMRAEQALRKAHDALEWRVEERTAELVAANRRLRQEIIERKRAEEALRRSEQEKTAILNSMSELMVYQDTERRVLWANKAASESVGLAPGQLVGRHCYEIWHQRDAPCAGCPVVEAYETGRPQETEMTSPDGRVWFVRGNPVRGASGDIIGIVEVTLDITERKRAKDLLRAQRDLALELSATSRLDEMLRLCVEAAVRITGMDAGGAYLVDRVSGGLDLAFSTGLSSDFVQAIAHFDADSANARLVMAGQPVYVRYGLDVHTDATRHHEGLQTVAVLPMRHEGQIIGCLNITSRSFDEIPATVRDTLETMATQVGSAIARARAQETLWESEERYRTTIDALGDAVHVVDRDLRFILFNEALRKMAAEFGIKQDPIGKTIFEHFSFLPARVRAEYEQALETGEPLATEEATTIGQRTAWTETRKIPMLDEEGRGYRVITIMRDITERKRMEEQIEGLNRLKEDLLSPRSLDEKLKCITDGVVAIFDADFARIWITQPGDLCDSGCFHARVTQGPHACRYRDRCLHLIASSGRYTHVDGEVHRRVPFGCYKIGRVAAGQESKFITNDVTHNARVHDLAWARELGLVSFAGYRLLSEAGKPIGVLALFSKHVISPDEDALLEGLANTTAQVIQTARAEEALRQLNRNLFLLNRVGQELTTALDQLQITERLLAVVTEIVGAEGASVWLWEEEPAPRSHGDAPRDWLVCRAASPHGPGESPLNMRVRPDQGVVGWVVRNGKSAIVPYAPDDARFFPGIDEQTGFHTLSLLAAPLWVRGKVIGALEAVNKLDGDFVSEQGGFVPGQGGFDDKDLTLLETLAASAAIAIDNAELVEALGRRTVELQARNEDLDAYAHTVAHDLKGPLACMTGFAQALEQDCAELPIEELRRHLRSVSRNGCKMNNIIDELLLMAGLRRTEVELVPLDMASVVDEALERLAYMIEECQAQIVLPENWPMALGCSPWVEEVWANYLSNALKYGGRPPRVKLGAEEPAGRMVRFWVRDNGPGLTPEEQERLFRSFERLDRTRAKGHGLGLSIVRRIVEKLGGEVGVESEVGQGSMFWFALRRG